MKSRRGRATSRLGRVLGSWGIAGNPSLVSLVTSFSSHFTIHIGLVQLAS